MATTPKIHRPTATTLLALAVLIIVSGCAESKNAAGGSFTDPRDGKTYRTVRIGGLTWMAENLNFVTDSSVCYNNDESNCLKYGRLYSYWDDAMKVCPAGWHLPSDAEWTALTDFVGGEEMAGTKLKSKTRWFRGKGYKAATDDYGFSALPGGSRWSADYFLFAREGGNWWSATEVGAYNVWYRHMYFNNESVGRNITYKTYLHSVRCVEGPAALAAIAVGCGNTAERKDADTVQTAAATASSDTVSGTFTDSRDGKTYRTVKIGNQTWMAENLNYKTGNSVCYDNEESNCQKYGRLYYWDDAMKACPAGWHLPSDAEWTALTDFVGGREVAGTKLKSKTGWYTVKAYKAATDDYGFSALPGGFGLGLSDGRFDFAGSYGFWWSATEYKAGNAWGRGMDGDYEKVGRNSNYKTGLFSLRCSQDSADLR